MNVQAIIDQMPDNIKEKVALKANQQGVSLETFVENQLERQLNEEALEFVAGGTTDTDVVIRVDDPGDVIRINGPRVRF